MVRDEERMEEEVYPDEEQGIEPEETSEEKEMGMESGEREAEVYDKEGREKLEDDSEIEPWEEAFMEGAEGKGELGDCANCGKPLGQDKAKVVEREINGELYWFCNDDCAGKGPSS